MTKRNYKGVAVAERPWSALTQSQREARLDQLPWHERELFLALTQSDNPVVKQPAERASMLAMKHMIATVKSGGDPGAPKPKHPKKSDTVAAPATPQHKNLDRLVEVINAVSRQADSSSPGTEASGPGVVPEPESPSSEGTARLPKTPLDFERIRASLNVNGRLRLDPEAVLIFKLAPSFHAIATGLNPEDWQIAILDSFAPRIGCLAARQCGKSLVTSRKSSTFAICNPGSTALVVAPSLRQSSEFLKATGVMALSGIRLASQSQFAIILGSKQPGEGARIIALPGSGEDGGASVRGYASDMLVLEEASFMNDVVVATVLPSIAAREKAQIVSISSAGLVGSWFHTNMTDPASGWEKYIVAAEESGRFTQAQLDELRRTLGARYAFEMQCRFSTQGEGLFDEGAFAGAFGTATDPNPGPMTFEEEENLAFAHLDMERIFTHRVA